MAIKQAEADWVRGLIQELTDGSLGEVGHWRTWHQTGKFPAEWSGHGWARADRAIAGEADPPEDDRRTTETPGPVHPSAKTREHRAGVATPSSRCRGAARPSVPGRPPPNGSAG